MFTIAFFPLQHEFLSKSVLFSKHLFLCFSAEESQTPAGGEHELRHCRRSRTQQSHSMQR